MDDFVTQVQIEETIQLSFSFEEEESPCFECEGQYAAVYCFDCPHR